MSAEAIAAMEQLPVIYRGPSQSVVCDLRVSQLSGKPWTTWLEDYSRLAGENLALTNERERLQTALELIRQGPPRNLKPKKHHDWARGIANTYLGPEKADRRG